MLKLGRVTKVKVLLPALVFVFNFDLFKFSVAILEKGLLDHAKRDSRLTAYGGVVLQRLEGLNL